MRNALRLLSTPLMLLHELSWGRWLINFVLGAAAAYNWLANGLQQALPWLIPALAVLLAGELSERLGYTFFLPDADLGAGAPEVAPPWGTEALASGHLCERVGERWRAPRLMQAELVRLYWLAEKKPVRLAVIQPWIAEADERYLADAMKYSVWYRGSDVTTGWVIIGWQVYPGVRLRYIGITTTLGVGSPGEARALARSLALDA